MKDLKEKGQTKVNIYEAINLYKELSTKYSNNEIVSKIKATEEYKTDTGDLAKTVDAICSFLESSTTEKVNNLLTELDLDTAIAEAGPNATLLDIIQNATKDMSITHKANLMLSLVTTTKVLAKIAIGIVVLEIYKILIRCVIYKKAKKHAWASFIPLYRDIVMFKICGMSPWLVLLYFVPVVGWFILFLAFVASRFNLAESFDKGVIFSFGLLLFPTLFETILAISRKTKYIGIEK